MAVIIKAGMAYKGKSKPTGSRKAALYYYLLLAGNPSGKKEHLCFQSFPTFGCWCSIGTIAITNTNNGVTLAAICEIIRNMNLTVKVTMYRILFFCLITSFYCSCKNHATSYPVNAPQSKQVVDSLRYSAYYLSPNFSSSAWETRIVHLLEVDGYGHFSLLRKIGNSQQYFRGTVPDNLLTQIDQILSEHKRDTTYSFNPIRGYLYDGYKYILDYHSNHRKTLIQFIPPEAPDDIRRLSTALDSFITTVMEGKVNWLNFQGYEKEIQRLSEQNITQPPPILNTTKFTPVKLR